jgi:hypothetical protein
MEFMEAGRRCLAGDTARAGTASEVLAQRREARALQVCVCAVDFQPTLNHLLPIPSMWFISHVCDNIKIWKEGP